MIHRADVAMYRAKARGRNTVQVHDPPRGRPRRREAAPAGASCAPASSAASWWCTTSRASPWTAGSCAGVEALVRWDHPAARAAGPGALHRRRRGLRADPPPGREGPRDRHRPGRGVGRARARHRDRRQPLRPPAGRRHPGHHGRRDARPPRPGPGAVDLEVTETALMADPDAALATLSALKALGTTLAVDDFGTGYRQLHLPPALPPGRAEDRPLVRGDHERAPRRRPDRGHLACTWPAPWACARWPRASRPPPSATRWAPWGATRPRATSSLSRPVPAEQVVLSATDLPGTQAPPLDTT